MTKASTCFLKWGGISVKSDTGNSTHQQVFPGRQYGVLKRPLLLLQFCLRPCPICHLLKWVLNQRAQSELQYSLSSFLTLTVTGPFRSFTSTLRASQARWVRHQEGSPLVHQSHGQSLLCPDPCVTWGSLSEKSDPGSSILHTLAGFPGPESMLFWNCHSCSSNFILIWFDLFWKSHFFPPILSWFGLTSAYGTGSATGTDCGGCIKPISFDIRFRSFLPLTFL